MIEYVAVFALDVAAAPPRTNVSPEISFVKVISLADAEVVASYILEFELFSTFSLIVNVEDVKL